jgi:23S rRNA pseudoU1915 N3-methylase RlmH
MRLFVIAVGRLKQGPERELAERYHKRFDDIGRKLGFRGLDIHEIGESRARDAATRMAEEAAAILGSPRPCLSSAAPTDFRLNWAPMENSRESSG